MIKVPQASRRTVDTIESAAVKTSRHDQPAGETPVTDAWTAPARTAVQAGERNAAVAVYSSEQAVTAAVASHPERLDGHVDVS